MKPENILIDRDGNAYLTDFGMALAPDGGSAIAAANSSTGASLDAPYASPEQLGGHPMSPASDVYSLAVVAARALTGLTGDYEAVRGALPASGTHGARPCHRPRSASPVLERGGLRPGPDRSARRRRRQPLLDDAAIENPYKGLRAFAAADAADFFGRERLVERLIARLGEPGTRGRFVAVVGPSGSGKSSVVRAGLVPALAARRVADVAGLVPRRDDTGAAPVRGARGSSQSRGDRSPDLDGRHRPRTRWRAAGRRACPPRRTATSCCW